MLGRASTLGLLDNYEHVCMIHTQSTRSQSCNGMSDHQANTKSCQNSVASLFEAIYRRYVVQSHMQRCMCRARCNCDEGNDLPAHAFQILPRSVIGA